MLAEATLLRGGELFHLVEDLRVRFACERSVRLCRGKLLPNRFLLTFNKDALAARAERAILDICRQIHMPGDFEEAARQKLADAQHIHFGFEEDDTACLYKLYLEFPATATGAVTAPYLLHLAFKWDLADARRRVQTEYWLYPLLTTAGIVDRLRHVYANAEQSVSFDIARGIVEYAAQRRGMPAAAAAENALPYLEVGEDNNQRRSFDINLYDARLRVEDFGPFLRRTCEHFAIPAAEFEPFYERIKGRRFGHLAGGVHRRGQDFFNLYYGAEWHDADRRPRPGRTGWAMKLVERFEHTTERDQYYNYCWWPYLPVAPVEKKYRPVNLLFQTFELAGLDERAFELVRRIQGEVGLFRTVWGVKWLPDAPHRLTETAEAQDIGPGRLAWEFYFYDYQRRDREVSISRVLKAIAPLIRCGVPVNESLPYFMFSLDVNGPLLSGQRDLDVVHMYIGNPGSRVSSGIAYGLTAERSTLENFYFFFDARRDLRQAAEKILCSAHVDAARVDIDRILRPELRDCHTICVANKQINDTAYFSGVNVDQLSFFLKLLRFPPEICRFVEENRGKLDHLLYDVGYDFVAKGNEIVVLKSGYYGVF